MIPIRLKLTGFLSYHDAVDVDFTTFKLACISGHNGAGKSSLLDAITWVLFGQARKTGEALINNSSNMAEVDFIFRYEENGYRIRRTLEKGRSTVLEFQIQDGEAWRPLTEATGSATQDRIKKILRLDYDTFINASFFLQGKADQFTQQRPGERKAILSNILGLEIWDEYRERAAELRKGLEREVDMIDARVADINTELGEEPARRARLKELELELARQQETRKNQENLKAGIDQLLAALERQQEQNVKLGKQIETSRRELDKTLARRSARETEREAYAAVTSRAAQVETAHHEWQTTRARLEKLDALASKFREQEKERQAPLARIGAEQARLEQERENLAQQQALHVTRQGELARLEQQLALVNQRLTDLETRLGARSRLEKSQEIVNRFREQARLRQPPLAEINAEKARLEQELSGLEKQFGNVETQRAALVNLESDLREALEKTSRSEAQIAERKTLEADAQTRKELLASLRNSNDRLKLEKENLDARIRQLNQSDGAICPLCGQPLNAADRQKLIETLTSEGRDKAEEFNRNRGTLEDTSRELNASLKEIERYSQLDKTHQYNLTNQTKLEERLQANQKTVSEWQAQGAPRLAELRSLLQNQGFSPKAHQQLARIDRELAAIGQALGVSATEGKSIFETIEEKVIEMDAGLAEMNALEQQRGEQNTLAARLNEQAAALRAASADWLARGEPRLAEIDATLQSAGFALAERAELAKIDAHLKSLGYDPAAHADLRQRELSGRAAENDLRELQAARAALAPIDRELQEIDTQLGAQRDALALLEKDFSAASQTLADMRANTPDAEQAERALLEARQQENILNRETGAAQQKVNILQSQRERKASLEASREEFALNIRQHKTLERAFGRDGVPAMLIEQALPQIEEKANELLDRLSNGNMSVRFVTQAEYKTKKREDLKETLEIKISDGAGTRDYEMYSGGEAFRVNFAIRLALSEVLARRTGARLQTLVIDEGFGSQDAEGRQRLIEAINLVKSDFEKILIITHLDELKDAFPNRIEVEKTANGSRVQVL